MIWEIEKYEHFEWGLLFAVITALVVTALVIRFSRID